MLSNHRLHRIAVLIAIFAVILSACAPQATPTPEPTDAATEETAVEPTEEATEEAVVEATEEAAAEPTEEATEEAVVEATEEAAAEPTEEATVEAVVEATEEAAAEPTEEATVEAVVEATEEVAAEATEEATVEATEEATPEPTEVPTEEAAAPTQTIVGLAIGNSDLSTLAAAVVRAGLVGTLNGEGPYTVFAPTNDAFTAALEALGLSAAELLANRELLGGVLTYHVVEGAITSDMLESGEVTTVNGAVLTVTVNEDGTVSLTDGQGNSANVVLADVLASNGVVHVIDAVLLPPAE
jgi:uncharacterized surface protein with fasciclin (FAS1) repeats